MHVHNLYDKMNTYFACTQISMSAQLVHTIATKCASTLLVLTHAAACRAIVSMRVALTVKVKEITTCIQLFCICNFEMSDALLYCTDSTDINECREETDSCEQNCVNTIGSYTCGCRDGYRLNRDGIACNGMSTCMI